MGRHRASALTAFSAVFSLLAAAACGAPQPAKQPKESGMTHAVEVKTSPARTGRVDVRGVSYYYEIHGQGEPLLLLHGGLGSIDMFGPVLGELAKTRQVIGVDLHGHGRTTLGDRKISIPDMGDDLATVLEHLGYRQLDALLESIETPRGDSGGTL